MSEVFISYRQTNDEQLKRVRGFAQRLRDHGIDVVLDQFFEDDNPAGPNEGWPQWSIHRAAKTDYVLIIGTESWFQCADGTQPPGTGLGAACEARVIRQRIYEASGVIDDIRIVIFDDPDAATIPIDLRGYPHFHADRDFEKIVRWLGGKLIIDTPRTSIPHNLPSLQPFFGREEELKKIANALDPESRTWGALIDGPGGMGKTSLAVRAAYDALPEHFEDIVFISLKSRELDDDGERDLSGFLITGLAELFNELARRLGQADIAKALDEQRPRLLLDALAGTRTLLILDNLESLLKRERDVIFNFVKRLPAGCKAILTSRRRIGSAAEELILEKLGEQAALYTLEELAERNPALAKRSKEERRNLYRETGGKPLLLRWTAGQIGRANCLTLNDAIIYLRSCPDGNDPLEFIFGDLVEDFSEIETHVLCALTYFTLPAKVDHIHEVAELPSDEVDRALRSLVNRSLVVPSDELKTFSLVPLVADFLRKKKPEVVAVSANKLKIRAYMLVMQNGYKKYDRFSVLDFAWPTVAASLPCFITGPSEPLQTMCNALNNFLNFTGRWDESLALALDAERKALMAKDFTHAGWRAYSAGCIEYQRAQSAEVLACADRAESHWRKAQSGARELACAVGLRGHGYLLTNDFGAAIGAYREAVELDLTLGPDTNELASDLNDLADAERLSGDLDAAERDYREALRIDRRIGDHHGIAIRTSNLAQLALDREDWNSAEVLAREALTLSENLGRQELVAYNFHRVAEALLRQGKKAEARLYAQRAVIIFTRLSSPILSTADRILTECDS